MSAEEPSRVEAAAPPAPPEGVPAPADRPSPRAIPRRLAGIAVAFVLVALATRFYRLGDRPYHHDESIHAHQSYVLMKDGNWRYDPAYHGPFLYYANALVYRLLGVTDTTARFLPAAFGLLLIAAAFPLARWIGGPAAAAYALLVLISPHFTYFSRFIREDVYSLVFTLGAILAFRAFLDTDRARWLTLSAVSFALAGATKENAYMTGVLFVAFAVWALAERVARTRGTPGALAGALAATVRWVRARILPILTAGIVFLAIWILMYTAFGKYPGDWLAIPKAINYWMGQHSIARIPGPWYYYVPQLLYYETAIVFAALFAFRRSRSSPFLRFVLFWAIGSLLLYAWAREKVPWLTVHALLPITILAAVGLAGLWRDRRETGPRLALSVFFVLALVNASGMLLASFRYGAHDLEREPKHAEIIAYVQTTEDLVRALAPVETARARVPEGQAVITVSGEASWPLTWYLRDTPTRWVPRIEDASTPIVVADWDPQGGVEKQLAGTYTAKRVPIRAWWFAEKYQPDPKAPARPSPTELVRWWLFHEIWSRIGSQDAVFFVRKDLETTTGPLMALTVPVQNTTARDYSAVAAAPVPPARSIGAFGTGPAQFAEPRGLATDAAGNLYVADTKNHRVQVFDPGGSFLRALGTGGSEAGQLKEPCGVAVAPDGTVFVADTWNHRVARFGPNGAWLGAWTDEKPFFGPRSVLFSKGSVYVADTGNKRIVRFDEKGRRVSEWGGNGNGPGQFIEPVGLAADVAGNVYVADTGNHRIQVFDAEGKFLREIPAYGWKDFYTEPYIAIVPNGSILTTDSTDARVNEYDSTGQFKRSWRAEGEFKKPTGITVDPQGRIIVSDRETHLVHVWNLADVLR